MAPLPTLDPRLEVWAVFRTTDPVADIPELREVARIEDVSKYHPGAACDIRVASLNRIGADWAIRAMQKHQVRIARLFLSPQFATEFWDNPPPDCSGGVLQPDGHVSVADATLNWRIVPLSEPLFTSGRPEADSEHSRFRPHVLNHAGGIPIISDELLATLRQLGVAGETAPIIYRGFSKKAYDTVQPGYKRFLVQPEYEMPIRAGFDFLPETMTADFAFCSLRRTHGSVPEVRVPGISRNMAEDTWYEIALATNLCGELRQLRKSVLIDPIFSRSGPTFEWVTQVEAAVQALRATD